MIAPMKFVNGTTSVRGTMSRSASRRALPTRTLFFQAEDGIRDCNVTGVQTCALPIYALGTQFHRVSQFLKGLGLLALGVEDGTHQDMAFDMVGIFLQNFSRQPFGFRDRRRRLPGVTDRKSVV